MMVVRKRYLRVLFFFMHKPAYVWRISDWSSDVCSSDLHAAHHRRRGQVHRGDAAAAEAVERHARHGDLITRRQRCHAAEVGALLAALGRGRPDHIVDGFGVEVVAVADRGEHGRGKMLRMEARQSTRLNSSHYCAYRTP